MTIKEMKERGEKDDKVKFLGKVKNVYDAKDLTPEQKAKAKYTVSRQNVIVEDDTDNIQIIISHKKKEFEYTQGIIGKEVEVDGKLTLWEGKIKVFGKLIFKEGEAPAQKDNSTMVKPATVSVLPAGVELRKISLRMAIEFWGSRIGHEKEEKGVIETAEKFKEYLIGKEKIKKTSGQKEKQKEEPKELEGAKSEEQVITLGQDKIELINKIMEIREKKGINMDVFNDLIKNKDIKKIEMGELLKLKERLEKTTDEIPF